MKKSEKRTELENALAKIGWKIDRSGNGLNDFIINNKGQATSFVVQGDMLEIRKELFGESFMGGIYLKLDSIDISTGSITDGGEICRVTLAFNDDCYIQFYNHD